ncbi:DUF4097 family beta strand repeat-containing protein [Hymenobacter sp. HSC-4F20]|uniref:DUF4097 family beta strand repeat-containing protein n=1 Tax=Hymenobacter sp. HSC-4F20 TaxID=2864135 RepID=UPI001C72F5D0|nr:DUF4097 family beta strand repeat-containing protein [Hymenobacter sp. HSC-4F20]MBX0289312.1 DUF4097 family beta strand repeat-containing protein [Hymenobacter sp. HSC-4F20]
MNQLLFRTLLTLLVVLAGARPLAAQQASKEQLTVALSAPGKPGVLHLKLVGGSIRVEGTSGKDVVVDVANRAGRRETSPDEPAPSGMRRLSRVQGLDVTAQEKDNHVYLKTQSWQNPVDFVIRVPRQFSLQLATVNDGNIAVQNVAGELEISNVNGSIRLEDVAGSAVLTTVNGDIVTTFRDITSGVPMAFSSVNGKIDVSLPAKAKAYLKLKSDRGEIYSDFDLSLDNSTPKVMRTAKDGTYRVSQDSFTSGKINGGGPEFMMKTLNGNIYIRKAK